MDESSSPHPPTGAVEDIFDLAPQGDAPPAAPPQEPADPVLPETPGSDTPFVLEEGRGLPLTPDLRPYAPQPIPVRLIAVADMKLPAPPGSYDQLAHVYVSILGFVADPSAGAFVADNHAIRIEFTDRPIIREDYRPVGVEVPSLMEVQKKLLDAEIEFIVQRGIMIGDTCLAFADPAGNLLEVFEIRAIL